MESEIDGHDDPEMLEPKSRRPFHDPAVGSAAPACVFTEAKRILKRARDATVPTCAAAAGDSGGVSGSSASDEVCTEVGAKTKCARRPEQAAEGDSDSEDSMNSHVEDGAQQCEAPSWNELAAWNHMNNEQSVDSENDTCMHEPFCDQMESAGALGPGGGEVPSSYGAHPFAPQRAPLI